MTNKELIEELSSIAGELELQAYESGDFNTERYYFERAAVLREAAMRLKFNE